MEISFQIGAKNADLTIPHKLLTPISLSSGANLSAPHKRYISMTTATSPSPDPPGAQEGAVASSQQSPQDKRAAPRRGLERQVHIEAADGSSIPCSLSDVSKSGARLAVSDPAALPDEFMLCLKDDLRKWCQVVRRSDKHVGVKFIAAPQPLAPPVVPSDAPVENQPKSQQAAPQT
jgi:hypothetical protein